MGSVYIGRDEMEDENQLGKPYASCILNNISYLFEVTV